MNFIARFTLFFLAIAGTSAAAPAPATASLEHRVDAYVADEIRKANIPGAAVAIVQGGKVVVAKGYGYANLEHEVPVNVDTIFQSGSVGKQMTAVLLMLLVEEGKVGLDDSITKYFPEAPAAWAPITIRHMLTHTAGIPEYTTPDFDYRRDYSEEEITRFAFALTPEFPPGARFSYSNTGYVLLGILIGKVSGQFYGDLLRERVFKPLGMKTARIISEEDIVPHRAAGYRLVDGTIKNQEWVAPRLNTTADGALYLSLQDFIAWDRGVRGGALLKPASWAQIFAPVKLASGKSYPYGFGWFIETAAGQPVLLHPGSWQGFRAQISRYLADDMSVLVLANSADADVSELSSGIAALVNPALIEPELKPIKDREPAVRARAEKLLQDAGAGRLSASEFAYLPSGQFEELAAARRERLAGLGPVQSLQLVKRKEVGDDRVYTYEAHFKDATELLRLELTPDQRISGFDLYPKP